MRVFVTGATGFIGSAVVEELLGAGHEVTGLARSEKAAAAVRDLGAAPHRGDLADPASYRRAAAAHDAVIHTAFDYAADSVERDRTACATLLAAAADAAAPRRVVYTSGCWVLGDTGDTPAAETASTAGAAELVRWRPAHEKLVLGADGADVRTSVVRPGMVYGGHGGLTAEIFRSAAEDGAAVIVGDGGNRWSMVHRDDLARLYRAIVESGAHGIFHGVDGNPMETRAIGRDASLAAGGDGSVRLVPVEEARGSLGPVADALVLDQVLAAPRSIELGWKAECSSFRDCAARAFAEWREASARR